MPTETDQTAAVEKAAAAKAAAAKAAAAKAAAAKAAGALKITRVEPKPVIIVVGGPTQAFAILGEGLDADKLKAAILDEAGKGADPLLVVEQVGQIAPNRFSVTARAVSGAKPGKRKIVVWTDAGAADATDGILVV